MPEKKGLRLSDHRQTQCNCLLIMLDLLALINTSKFIFIATIADQSDKLFFLTKTVPIHSIG